VTDDMVTVFYNLGPIPLYIICCDWFSVVEIKYPIDILVKNVAADFDFPLTASSFLTNVALVQWPRCEKDKLWRHRNNTDDKSYKSTEVWMLNRFWFWGTNWFWFWHGLTATSTCTSVSAASTDACRHCR